MKGFIIGLLLGAVAVIGGGWYYVNNNNMLLKTVVVMEVNEGVSADDVIVAMESKATELNMKMVGNQPLHKELEARGIESGHLEIFQYCNPEDARQIVNMTKEFAAYMPCRIALVEEKGKLYLTMLDMDLMIKTVKFPPDLLKIAEKVRDQLNGIMKAGASGEF
jgi:uncharacterized protein (DUF302 family)